MRGKEKGDQNYEEQESCFNYNSLTSSQTGNYSPFVLLKSFLLSLSSHKLVLSFVIPTSSDNYYICIRDFDYRYNGPRRCQCYCQIQIRRY